MRAGVKSAEAPSWSGTRVGHGTFSESYTRWRLTTYRRLPICNGVNDLVSIAKALADQTRVRIISALLERELCVCELCDSLEVTQSTLSTHLQVIREAGLVSARKEGKWMYYEIHQDAHSVIEALFKLFRSSLRSDAALRGDAQRLGRRLSMRNNGTCCVGFAISPHGTKKQRP